MSNLPETKRPILIWLVIVAYFMMGIYLTLDFFSSIPIYVSSYSTAGEYFELTLLLLWGAGMSLALFVAAVGLYCASRWVRQIFIALIFVTASTALPFLPLFYQLFTQGDDSQSGSLLLLALSGVGPVFACLASIVSALIVHFHFRRLARKTTAGEAS